MSIYTGNPSFKETIFRKRFNLKGIHFTYYTVFDGKEDAMDFHKHIEYERDQIGRMEDISTWLGYVMVYTKGLPRKDEKRLREASCYHHYSEDNAELTLLFD